MIKFFVFLQVLYVIKIILKARRFKSKQDLYIKPKIAIVSLLLTCILLFGSVSYKSAVTKYATLDYKYGKYQLQKMTPGLYVKIISNDDIKKIRSYYHLSERYDLATGKYKGYLKENRSTIINNKTTINVAGDSTSDVINDSYFEVLDGEFYDNMIKDKVLDNDEEVNVIKNLTIKKVSVKAIDDRYKIERSKLDSFEYSLVSAVNSNYFSRGFNIPKNDKLGDKNDNESKQDDFYVYDYNKSTNEVTNKIKIIIPGDALINFDKTAIIPGKIYYIDTIELKQYKVSGEYFIETLKLL